MLVKPANILFLFFLSVLTSCGFSFQGAGSILPASVKNIYIEDTVNNSTNSLVGISLTEALQDRFARYDTLVVVDNVSEADAILSSEVLDVIQQSKSVTASSDIALELDTILLLSASLDTISGQTLWKAEKMRFSSSFGASSSAVVTSSPDFAGGNLDSSDISALNERELARGQEDQVIEGLAEKAAKRIYSQAVLPEF